MSHDQADPVKAAAAAAVEQVVRVADTERREECQAAYDVGFEQGWMAGYEAADADLRGRVVGGQPLRVEPGMRVAVDAGNLVDDVL